MAFSLGLCKLRITSLHGVVNYASNHFDYAKKFRLQQANLHSRNTQICLLRNWSHSREFSNLELLHIRSSKLVRRIPSVNIQADPWHWMPICHHVIVANLNQFSFFLKFRTHCLLARAQLQLPVRGCLLLVEALESQSCILADATHVSVLLHRVCTRTIFEVNFFGGGMQ